MTLAITIIITEIITTTTIASAGTETRADTDRGRCSTRTRERA